MDVSNALEVSRSPSASRLVPTQTARPPDVIKPFLSQQSTHNEHSKWYLASLQDSSKVITPSFDEAIVLLKKELALHESQILWLESHNSVAQAQDAVQSALSFYESKRRASKAREWLSNCSSRVLYYGSVFDVYAQHHPEYVSLAWGTMKFLFIAVLNHEELLAEISKAVSQIADVLPRNELHSCLYPTSRIQEAVSLVNAKILEFFLKAIQWFRQGKLMHSLSSIAKPFKISFKPLVAEIAERSRRVDELANAALKAEMRDHHLLSLKMMQMLNVQQQTQSLHSQTLLHLQQEHKLLFGKGQVEDIQTAFLLEDASVSEQSLEYCRSMRKRRRQKLPTQLPRAALSTLQSWVSDPKSSILLAEGQGVRTSSLDFAADFLDAVREKRYQVIWALSCPESDEAFIPTIHRVIRSLISQCLALNQGIVSDGINHLTTKHFQAAQNVEQWLALFERCVITIPRLFILVDLGLIEAAINNGQLDDEYMGLNRFLEFLQDLVERQNQLLKVVVLSWKFATATSLNPGDIFDENRIYTDLGRRVERMMRKPKYRAMYKRRNQRVATELRASVALE